MNNKYVGDLLFESIQKELIPFKFADDIVYSFTRERLGDEWCDKIGIPKGPDINTLKRIVKTIYGIIDDIGDSNKLLRKIIANSADGIIDKWYELQLGDDRTPHTLPQK